MRALALLVLAAAVLAAGARAQGAAPPYDDFANMGKRYAADPEYVIAEVHTYVREQPTTDPFYGLALVHLAGHYEAQRDYPRALAYLGRAERLARATGADSTLAPALTTRASIAYEEGEVADAVRHFREAATAYRRADDELGWASANHGLGLVYYDLGDYERATPAFEAFAEAAERAGRGTVRALALGWLSAVRHRLGDGAGALALADEALGVERLNRQSRPALLARRARALLLLGRTAEAGDAAEECLPITAERENRTDEADCLGALGLAAAREGRTEAARDVVARIEAIADAEGDGSTPLVGPIPNDLAELRLAIARAESDPAAEALALQHLLDLRTETDRRTRAAALAVATVEFGNEARELEVELAQEREAAAEERAGRLRAWLVGGGIALALLVALAAALARTARLRRRANALLAERAAEVERQRAEAEAALARSERLLGEREVLLREVHHRVKNNLQVVASLVNLQADTVRDEAALAALRQMRGRVEALALVHRWLHGDGDLRTVDAAGYVGELGRLLAASYAWSGSDVRVETDVAPVALDADTAVPLGLATSELIANALEHAFEKGEAGRVRLRFGPDGRGHLALVVEDSGAGLPPGLTAPPADSLGLQLASDLALQLGGTFEMGRSDALGGARFALRFPDPSFGDGASEREDLEPAASAEHDLLQPAG